jgi:hypothetical protein
MLLEDIKVLSLIENWRPENSLAINSGVDVIESGRYLDGIKSPDKFHCGIYRPKKTWRPLDAAEIEKVVGVTANTDVANTLCLVETPRKFLLKFYQSKLDQMSLSPAHWDEMMKSAFPSFADEIREWFEQEVFDVFKTCSAFVNFTRPGLDTTTFDVLQNRYRGMHIDNWGLPGRTALERDACGLRACVNLGFEAREIVFINLRLKSFLDFLTVKRGADEMVPLYHETYAQPLAEDFLNDCNDYPVIKVSLEPCQAYIGPVQNIIHDGYTMGKKFRDVNIQLSANEFRHQPRFISSALLKGALNISYRER